MENNLDKISKKLSSIVTDIVKDYKKNISLVEDFVVKANFESDISFVVHITNDSKVDLYDVEGQYFRHDDTIDIFVRRNKKLTKKDLYNLELELIEVIRHELEHVFQFFNGYRFRKEPKTSFKYYTQKNEIGAQIAGFKLKSKISKVDYETIVTEWFDRNKKKHRLTEKEVKKVIKKLL